MIFELRSYTLKPASAGEVAKLSGGLGREIRGNDYGKLEGYWVTEVGALNVVHHMWSFASLDERARLRAELGKNQRWVNDYIPKIRENLIRQDVRLLNPAVGPKAPPGKGNLYEFRFYRLKPTTVGQWLANFKAALPVREKYSPLVGLWSTEAGQPNEVCHLWAYADFKQRMDVRDAVAKDQDWQATVLKNRPLMEAQETMLLLPAAHSPLQ